MSQEQLEYARLDTHYLIALRERQLEETTIAQIARMVHDHFSTFKRWPSPSEDGLIHLDDREMREDVQAEVEERMTRELFAVLREA